jgi:hypothetical protein
MRRHHEAVGAQIFIQAKIVIQQEVEEIAIVIGLPLREKQGSYHGSTVGLDHGKPVLSVALNTPRIAMDGSGRPNLRGDSIIKVGEQVNR